MAPVGLQVSSASRGRLWQSVPGPAAEGVRGVEDGAAPAGSWQGWQGVKGVRAKELGLHAVHRKRRVPVSSLVRQSLVLGAMFACLSRH